MNVKSISFFRKLSIFPRLKKTPDRQLFLVGLALITAFLCWAIAPYSASGVDEPEQAIAQVRELQALGHYRQACGILLQALAVPELDCKTLIRDDAPDRVKDLFQNVSASPLTATELRMLGDILRIVGAVKTSEKVLDLSFKMTDESDISAVHFSLGNTKRALGKRGQYLNERPDEKKYYEAALEDYNSAIASATSESARLRVNLRKLSLLIETESNSNRTDFWRDVKSQVDNLPDNSEAVYIRIDLANSLTCLKVRSGEFPLTSNSTNFQPAIARLCKPSETIETRKSASLENYAVPEWQEIGQLLAIASQQSKQLGDARLRAYALGNLGELYELTQQYSTAQKLTEEAISIAQSIQASDIEYKWLWQLGRLHVNLGNKEAAIAAYTEAFNTLQNLRKDLASLNRDVQFSFRDEVEPIYRELVDLLLKAEQPNQDNLKLAREAIEALQLAELDDFFRDACSDAKPEQIDRVVDESNSAAVFYTIILPEKLAVIVKLPNKTDLLPKQTGLYYYSTTTAQQAIENTLDKLRTELIEIYPSRKAKELSNRVYNWLIEPAEKALNLQEKGITTLVFVLDGSLRKIPMAALYDGREYLLQNYSVALAPGLQLLSPKPLTRENLSVLGGGVSKQQTIDGKDYISIANVENELEQVANKILLNEDFTLSNFQTNINLDNFSVVHIATHGEFSSDPDKTYIVAWGQLLKVADLDNLLRIRDRAGSKEIELLILTACNTAKGDPRATLGMAGVAVRAGARSTIASLWRAGDQFSSLLVEEFYKQLKENPDISKAEALRQAQLKLIERSATPYNWAPYILLGNWQ